MVDVLVRARTDLQQGNRWLARERLQGYIGSMGYQRDVVELLGRTCWEMGDVPAAGRYWFFTTLDCPEKQLAVQTFVQRHSGGAAHLTSALPRRLRQTRPVRLPAEVVDRLATLQRMMPTKPPKHDTRPHGGPQRINLLRSLDTLTLTVGMCLAVFFLLCFSIGLAQLLGL